MRRSANILSGVPSSIWFQHARVDDSYSVHQGQTLSVPVATGALANDSDVDGDTLTAYLATGPQNGALSFYNDGSFTYTPYGGYVGSDSFSYTVTDGALTDTAIVSIQVTDAAPVATNDAFTLNEDTPLSVLAASGVLANDTDIDSPILTAVLVDGPQHGTLSLAADGGFLYTPNADYFGSDSFTYRANDGQLDSNLALVTLTIAPVTAQSPTRRSPATPVTMHSSTRSSTVQVVRMSVR